MLLSSISISLHNTMSIVRVLAYLACERQDDVFHDVQDSRYLLTYSVCSKIRDKRTKYLACTLVQCFLILPCTLSSSVYFTTKNEHDDFTSRSRLIAGASSLLRKTHPAIHGGANTYSLSNIQINFNNTSQVPTRCCQPH